MYNIRKKFQRLGLHGTVTNEIITIFQRLNLNFYPLYDLRYMTETLHLHIPRPFHLPH